MTAVAEEKRTRRGGRGSRREIRTAIDDAMLPALKRGLPLTEPMDEEQIARIDAASMDILEEVGVVFRDPVALEDWKRVGADVRGERVHLDRALVRGLIATIPETFIFHARNPVRARVAHGWLTTTRHHHQVLILDSHPGGSEIRVHMAVTQATPLRKLLLLIPGLSYPGLHLNLTALGFLTTQAKQAH